MANDSAPSSAQADKVFIAVKMGPRVQRTTTIKSKAGADGLLEGNWHRKVAVQDTGGRVLQTKVRRTQSWPRSWANFSLL